jgi:hypothetical protein
MKLLLPISVTPWYAVSLPRSNQSDRGTEDTEERKGKERKGKERKGKERKGKERKGKERAMVSKATCDESQGN